MQVYLETCMEANFDLLNIELPNIDPIQYKLTY